MQRNSHWAARAYRECFTQRGQNIFKILLHTHFINKEKSVSDPGILALRTSVACRWKTQRIWVCFLLYLRLGNLPLRFLSWSNGCWVCKHEMPDTMNLCLGVRTPWLSLQSQKLSLGLASLQGVFWASKMIIPHKDNDFIDKQTHTSVSGPGVLALRTSVACHWKTQRIWACFLLCLRLANLPLRFLTWSSGCWVCQIAEPRSLNCVLI